MEWAYPSDRELQEITQAMDNMMEYFFSMPLHSQSYHTITIYSPEMQHQSPKRVTLHDLNFVADSAASQLASQTEPEHIPALAEKLNMYGERLMASSAEGKPDHHIGRRLTEVANPASLGPHVRLPFGCHKNACLMNSLPRVSTKCDLAIKELQSISKLEYQQEEKLANRGFYMLVDLAILVVFSVLLFKKASKDLHHTKVGQKILEAIYANPKLKRQVEREMGQSVGNEAPVPRFGNGFKKRTGCLSCIRLLIIATYLYAFLFSPGMVIPAFIMAFFFRHKPDNDNEEEEEEEEEDLAKPLLQGKGQKHTFEAEKVVVDGVSVQIV